MIKSLIEIHEDVPPDHYDRGIKNNLFQKYWHWRRFREVSKIITPVDGKILDVGCHSGLFTQVIISCAMPQQIYGIDISKSAIKRAQQRIKGGFFVTADAQVLPFGKNFFDVVFCLEVLEHIEDVDKVLSEISRVLKKGGLCFVLVPTDNWLFKLIWKTWNWYYPVWKHAHIQSFTNQKLEKKLKKNGFYILSIKNFNFGMLKLIKFTKA